MLAIIAGILVILDAFKVHVDAFSLFELGIGVLCFHFAWAYPLGFSRFGYTDNRTGPRP